MTDRLRRIFYLQNALLKLPQVEIPVTHTFPPGLYVRTILIPATTLLVGEIHSEEHVFILSKGKIAVATEDDGETLSAPYYSVCRPLLKRVGYVIEDAEVSTVHANPTGEQNPDDLLKMITVAERDVEWLLDAGDSK
ncbi:MAG: hypothetical protein H7839_04760 [Magnetococcus sp. YQC-5]